MSARTLLALVAAAIVIGLAAAILLLAQPKSAEQREQAADDLAGTVSASAVTQSTSLLATGAFADFGLGRGISLVHVRIVDDLNLQVTLSATREVALADDPRLCLVGPFSAPDDAGLEDRCWGQPDLSAVTAEQAGWADGQRLLHAGQPLVIDATLRRGDVRCDYSPGDWVLEVKLNPLVDGSPAGARYIGDAHFSVPIPEHGPLPLLLTDQTRYCGLATAIVNEQGEPETAR
jgi:hypothetical protein